MERFICTLSRRIVSPYTKLMNGTMFYIFIEIHDRIGGYPYKTMVLFVLVMILLNSQVQILFKRLDREY